MFKNKSVESIGMPSGFIESLKGKVVLVGEGNCYKSTLMSEIVRRVETDIEEKKVTIFDPFLPSLKVGRVETVHAFSEFDVSEPNQLFLIDNAHFTINDPGNSVENISKVLQSEHNTYLTIHRSEYISLNGAITKEDGKYSYNPNVYQQCVDDENVSVIEIVDSVRTLDKVVLTVTLDGAPYKLTIYLVGDNGDVDRYLANCYFNFNTYALRNPEEAFRWLCGNVVRNRHDSDIFMLLKRIVDVSQRPTGFDLPAESENLCYFNGSKPTLDSSKKQQFQSSLCLSIIKGSEYLKRSSMARNASPTPNMDKVASFDEHVDEESVVIHIKRSKYTIAGVFLVLPKYFVEGAITNTYNEMKQKREEQCHTDIQKNNT